MQLPKMTDAPKEERERVRKLVLQHAVRVEKEGRARLPPR